MNNISFIIIAHNEAYGLIKCLSSLQEEGFLNSEIICVDSGSTDTTLDTMRSFSEIFDTFKIIQITGYQNASIARNEGIKLATREYIFFLDGDVSITRTFVYEGVNIINNNADAVIGILDEIQYSDGFINKLKYVSNITNITKTTSRYLCGGIFLTRKAVIQNIGYFDPALIKGQDFDYTLRLTRKYKLTAIPINMGVHHTIPYSNKHRLTASIKQRHMAYHGYLIRKNLSHYKGVIAYANQCGHTKGIVFYLIVVMATCIYPISFLYALVFIITDVLAGKLKKQDLTYRFITHYIYPFHFLVGLLFRLLPSNHKNCVTQVSIVS